MDLIIYRDETMRIIIILSCMLLASCVRGPDPIDPYENYNRKVHKFNMAFDATFIKPPATLYKTVVPGFVRTGVNNFFSNINMVPTIINDLLQCEINSAVRDSWRLLVNTTMGIAGVIDVASSMGLSPHNNDLGITFAKWGDTESPYLVIPFLGPSTVRDGFSTIFNYGILSPYPYLFDSYVLYGLFALRVVDLRSQYLNMESIMSDAIDNYTFVRDAFLQMRKNQIYGGVVVEEEELYIEEGGMEEEIITEEIS